jgi:hypothetical protein
LDKLDGTYVFPDKVSFGAQTSKYIRVEESEDAEIGEYKAEIGEYKRTYPEICLEKSPQAMNGSNLVPNLKSKRIALLLRGDSLRGLSYGVEIGYKDTNGVEKTDKLPFYCTEKARAIQKATAAAHLKYIVEPIERSGFKVDILLSTYGCTGVKHLTEAKQREVYEELVAMYGTRVVAHQVFDRTSVQEGVTQDTGIQQAMMLLLRTAYLDYTAVLLWRFDVVPLKPMGPANSSLFFDAQRPHKMWQQYAAIAGSILMWFDDDWGYSFPGWYADCAIGAFLHHCMQESLICQRALKLNFPSYQWVQQEHGHRYYIYRDDFSKPGREICKLLETKFQGPKCAATTAGAWKEACAYAGSKGTFGELDLSECYKCKGATECKNRHI